MKCNICDTVDIRLVRDHDHHTGFIRGILCEKCNSWLGVYERNRTRIKQRGKRKYKTWVASFSKQIENHLQCNTGVKYKSTRWGKPRIVAQMRNGVYTEFE